ncbi:MAG: cysteine desulfurase family protein [Candidatus Heimdallarchaeota archaeon]
MRQSIYLDHGATTPVVKEVLEAMLPYFSKHFGIASTDYGHSFGVHAREAIESAREILANAINADPQEIVFTSGGTEANNLAIKGVALANRDKGTHLITSKIEHSSVLDSCDALKAQGFEVTYLDVDKDGFVNLGQLADAIRDSTILVSIQHANEEIGTVQPLQEIGKICAEQQVLFHTDAVQSFTKVPIDVKAHGLALASFSAHKIHGPKGIGALFVKRGIDLTRMLDGGFQERRRRAGTENVPGIVGFGRAIQLVKEDHIQHMIHLRDKLIEAVLTRIPHTQLTGPHKGRLCNHASFVFNYVEGESMLLHLDMRGIAVATGSACSSKRLEASHVLTAIGLPPEVSHGSLRFTLGRENTEEEIDLTVENLIEIVEKLRKISPLNELSREWTHQL